MVIYDITGFDKDVTEMITKVINISIYTTEFEMNE